MPTKMSYSCRRCGKEFFGDSVREESENVCPRCLFGSVLGGSVETVLKTELEDASDGPSRHTVGTEFGNYVILGVLGTGGMGVVYRAKQKGLERNVALKILPSGEDAPENLVDRFFREARAAAALKHPNIVPIHEVSNHEGSYFYSMELVEGSTFAQAIRDADPGSRELVEILAKVARAVHFAHEKGVIHRDIKPANIMVDPKGEPKVLDFGIAKTLGTRSKATATGSAMGTPAYMSPEQVRGAKDVDARADVYSLGAVLYEILVGKVPHEGTSAMEIFRKLETDEVRAPSKTNSKVHRDLEVICLKALEKDKFNRYESAEALAADLERYLKGEPIWAKPAPWTRKAGRFLKRNIAWGAAASILILIGGVIYLKVKVDSRPDSKTVIVEKAGPESAPEVKRLLEQTSRTIESVRFGTSPPERRKRKKKIDENIAAIDGVIGKWPEHGELYYWRGRLNELANRNREAVEDYNQAVERNPRLGDARYRRNLCAWRIIPDNSFPMIPFGSEMSASAFKTAEEDVGALKELNIRPEQAILLRGLSELGPVIMHELNPMTKQGPDSKSALPELVQFVDQALEKNPRFLDAMIWKVFLSFLNRDHAKRPLEIQRLADDIVSQDPNSIFGYWFRALHYWRTQDFGKALPDVHQIREIIPEGNWMVMYLQAVSLHTIGDFDRSLRFLEAAIALNPGNAYVRFLRVSCRLMPFRKASSPPPMEVVNAVLTDLHEFLSLSKNGEELDPFMMLVRKTRAKIRFHSLKDRDGALEDYAVAKKLAPVPQMVPESLEEFVGSDPAWWGEKSFGGPNLLPEKRAREACIEYATFLCGRIDRGGDVGKLQPSVVSLVRLAIRNGYAPTCSDRKRFSFVLGLPGMPEKFKFCSIPDCRFKPRFTGSSLRSRCIAGDVENVLLNLIHGEDVNDASEKGIPLHDVYRWRPHSDQKSRKRIMMLLLEYGADPNLLYNGKNALEHSLDGIGLIPPADLIALIAGKIKDLNSHERMLNGETPLYRALKSNRIDVAKVLLGAGADINARNKNGWTPLWATLGLSGSISSADPGSKSTSGSSSALKWVLKNGGDLKLRDKIDRTPLYAAGRAEDVRLLLKKGADPNVRDHYRRTPLRLAVFSRADGAGEKVKILLGNGAKTNTGDKDGLTPLHEVHRIADAKALLSHKADLEARDKWGRTPLNVAVSRGDHAIVKVLVTAGADTLSVDGLGLTPLDIAEKMGNEAIRKLLQQE